MRSVATATCGLLLALTTACGSGSGSTPATSPAASVRPSPAVPGGLVGGSICRAYRAQIATDQQTLAEQEAAGNAAEAADLRAKIAAATKSAEAIPGCSAG